ncbi:MAG: hypothetical protein O7D30_10095 [Rickettsia endosymbiont of Ixodes persulcatus]|nr:hypothetical protein [Rickettsia endosymbiont of Ixodes persulcatus]
MEVGEVFFIFFREIKKILVWRLHYHHSCLVQQNMVWYELKNTMKHMEWRSEDYSSYPLKQSKNIVMNFTSSLSRLAEDGMV